MTAKLLRLMLLVLALSVGLVSCGGGSSTTTTVETEANAPAAEETEETEEAEEAEGPAGGTPPRAEKVRIAGFAYSPEAIRIQEGGKVIWQNEDSTPHTATADDGSFDTGPIEEGKIVSETFKQPGTFTYHCEIHPSMHGTIEVVPAE